MKNLARWILAYETMDQRRREENLALAEEDARLHPEMRAPILRLVSNGLSGHDSRHLASGPQNLIPTFVVCPVE